MLIRVTHYNEETRTTPHPLRQIIESCDHAITTKNYDALME